MSYTYDALNLLLRTKGTRLSSADDPATWSEEKKAEHLSYMLNTIKSSWEFVSYTFMIEGVTRAFTHELVRHRHGSYAQQSQRVTDVREQPVIRPDTIDTLDEAVLWDAAVYESLAAYSELIDAGVPIQDARGLLPTNMTTSIIAQFSLRSLHEMAKVRLCTRAAKEFQDAMRAMKVCVIEVHPWAEEFINVHCVAEGSCAFPLYGEKECPIWFAGLDHESAKWIARKRFNGQRYAAAPVARDGKAV
jgi:flavin-dependent thymidylate synthase